MTSQNFPFLNFPSTKQNSDFVPGIPYMNRLEEILTKVDRSPSLSLYTFLQSLACRRACIHIFSQRELYGIPPNNFPLCIPKNTSTTCFHTPHTVEAGKKKQVATLLSNLQRRPGPTMCYDLAILTYIIQLFISLKYLTFYS